MALSLSSELASKGDCTDAGLPQTQAADTYTHMAVDSTVNLQDQFQYHYASVDLPYQQGGEKNGEARTCPSLCLLEYPSDTEGQMYTDDSIYTQDTDLIDQIDGVIRDKMNRDLSLLQSQLHSLLDERKHALCQLLQISADRPPGQTECVDVTENNDLTDDMNAAESCEQNSQQTEQSYVYSTVSTDSSGDHSNTTRTTLSSNSSDGLLSNSEERNNMLKNRLLLQMMTSSAIISNILRRREYTT